jgi:UDP-2-acetamido-3-amino-2,3-dideoxy-glucuronate N-acetyltransferase
MKLALVGFGRWGKNLARAMDKMGILAAVVDGSEECRTEARVRYPTAFVCGNLSMLHGHEVTGVVLSTPAETHHELAVYALSIGMDVFTEKPMALSVRQALDMVQAAEKNHKKLFVGHVFEYHPAVIQILDLARSGYLGSIEYIASHQLGPGRVRDQENVIFSLAPHDVSMILRIMGTQGVIGVLPKRVSAHGMSHCAQRVAGTSVMNIDFGGSMAHVYVSWMNPHKRRQLTVIGSKRAVVFDDVAKKLTIHERTNDIHVYSKDVVDVNYDISTEPIQMEMEAFVQYLDSNVVPPTIGSEAVHVVRILEAAQESMANGSASVAVLG